MNHNSIQTKKAKVMKGKKKTLVHSSLTSKAMMTYLK
jgi:hypothetical protein